MCITYVFNFPFFIHRTLVIFVTRKMGIEKDIKSPLLEEVSEIPPEPAASKNKLKSSKKQALLGVTLAFISGVVFVWNNFLTQWLKLDFADIIFVRSFVSLTVMGSLSCYHKLSLVASGIKKKTRCFMVLQGVLGGIMITSGYGCVSLMPLGVAITLVFSAPIFTMVFACLCLKHKLGPFRAGLGLMLMVGAILVIQPPFVFDYTNSQSKSKLYYIGAILGVSTAALDGLVNISISFCAEIHSLVLLWWSGLGGFLVALITLTFHHEAKILTLEFNQVPYDHWIAYSSQAFLGLLAYFCMTKSLQMIDPTVVSFIRALEIILAYAVQALVLHQVPDYLAGIGAGLVVFSVAAIAWQDISVKK